MSSMSIAVITDVHGNLPALQAVLKEVERIGCDLVYHTGDSIAIGPFPGECLQLLLDRADTRMVMGNHERYLANGIPQPPPSYMSSGELEHQIWVRSELDEKQKAQVKSLPYIAIHEFNGLKVGFVHGRMREDGYDFSNVPVGGVEELDRYFSFIPADIVFYGHIHTSSRKKGIKEYVNPGSAGCSKDSLARFALLRIDGGSYSLNSCKVPYDKSVVLAELERRRVPDRDFIAKVFYGKG